MSVPDTLPVRRRTTLRLSTFMFVAGCVRYRAVPRTAAETLDAVEAGWLDAPSLGAFSRAGGLQGSWPPPHLGADAADGGRVLPRAGARRGARAVGDGARRARSAGARGNPTLVAGDGYNATTSRAGMAPWMPQLGPNMTIDVSGKRAARVRRAQFLAETARLNVVREARRVRKGGRDAYLDLVLLGALDSIQRTRARLQSEVVAILDGQQRAGETAGYPVVQARLARDAVELAVLGIAQQRQQADEAETTTDVAMHTAAIERGSLHRYVIAYGYVEGAPPNSARSVAEALLVPRVSGVVTEVRVVEGQHVVAGDLVARLDPRLADVAVQRAESALQYATRAADRQRSLVATDGTSPRAIQVAEQRVTEAQNAIAAARTARTLIDFVAPVAGTITGLTVRVGQSVAPSSVIGRVIDVRVTVDSSRRRTLEQIRALPVRTPAGRLVTLSQLVDVTEEPGQLELRREEGRQDVAVTARLEGRDLGSAMAEIARLVDADSTLPPLTVEYGGLYQEPRESFQNLLEVLLMAVALVFTVLLLESGTQREPLAIVFGAVLALVGTVLALWLTGTSFNVVSFLGAIMGVGLVAKNGILMLEYMRQLQAGGMALTEALVQPGRRRLRPMLMTSLAAALGMLPLAWGIGSGADMLQPLAIAVIGALAVAVVLSLVATPTVYYLLPRGRDGEQANA